MVYFLCWRRLAALTTVGKITSLLRRRECCSLSEPWAGRIQQFEGNAKIGTSHHRPRLTPRKEASCNIEPTALGGGERCTACYRIMTGIPAWLRRSHAPGWGDVAVAVVPGRNNKRLDRTRSEPRWKLGALSLSAEVHGFNNQE